MCRSLYVRELQSGRGVGSGPVYVQCGVAEASAAYLLYVQCRVAEASAADLMRVHPCSTRLRARLIRL